MGCAGGRLHAQSISGVRGWKVPGWLGRGSGEASTCSSPAPSDLDSHARCPAPMRRAISPPQRRRVTAPSTKHTERSVAEPTSPRKPSAPVPARKLDPTPLPGVGYHCARPGYTCTERRRRFRIGVPRRVWHDERLTEEARQEGGVQGSGALPRARVVGLVRSGLAGFGG